MKFTYFCFKIYSYFLKNIICINMYQSHYCYLYGLINLFKVLVLISNIININSYNLHTQKLFGVLNNF